MRIDQQIQPATARASTVLAAVIYMMTAYQRNRCPGLAQAIAAHLACLAIHPDADATVRQVADGVRHEWRLSAHGVDATPHANLPATLN